MPCQAGHALGLTNHPIIFKRLLAVQGEVIVTPNGGEPVHIQAGDLCTFPAGMSCT